MAVIVVGEDDHDLRPVLEMLLQASGHFVRAVDTGAKVLALASRDDVDMVVLDVALPGVLDGLDVTRRLRADAAFGFRPVLLISARATPTDVSLGREAGADDYLAKPFGPEEFLDRVEQLLGHGVSV